MKPSQEIIAGDPSLPAKWTLTKRDDGVYEYGGYEIYPCRDADGLPDYTIVRGGCAYGFAFSPEHAWNEIDTHVRWPEGAELTDAPKNEPVPPPAVPGMVWIVGARRLLASGSYVWDLGRKRGAVRSGAWAAVEIHLSCGHMAYAQKNWPQSDMWPCKCARDRVKRGDLVQTGEDRAFREDASGRKVWFTRTGPGTIMVQAKGRTGVFEEIDCLHFAGEDLSLARFREICVGLPVRPRTRRWPDVRKRHERVARAAGSVASQMERKVDVRERHAPPPSVYRRIDGLNEG